MKLGVYGWNVAVIANKTSDVAVWTVVCTKGRDQIVQNVEKCYDS